MNKTLNYIVKLYKRMISGIAFIPTIMIFASFFLAILIFNLDSQQRIDWLQKHLDFVFVHGAENARMILATIIGGIISLTVFSFSMVMVVLNRTSASLSPRVLPQLIAQKFHQVVLGFYMGTIVYSLILIIHIGPERDLPSFGILLSMILAICSLGLFIYFIHSISQSIQVDTILGDIHFDVIKQVENLKKSIEAKKEVFSEIIPGEWNDQGFAVKCGYAHVLNSDRLVRFLKNESLVLETCFYSGQFVTAGELLYRSDKFISDELKEKICQFIYISDESEQTETYFFNLSKISEIAVKALSPGINDPGTAIKAIRFLSVSFEKILNLPHAEPFGENDSQPYLLKGLPGFDELLFEIITPIRQYAGGSSEIYKALFELYFVLFRKTSDENCKVLEENLKALVATVSENIANIYDRKQLNKSISKIKEINNCSVWDIEMLFVDKD